MGDHLAEAVGDEERRAAALLLAPHHVEDALGEVGRERGGDLVQDQQLRVARERAREVEHPQQRQRQVGGLLAEVDLEVELAQVTPHLGDGRPGQAQVLRDGQVGHERRILEDGREADPRRLCRRGDAALLAVDADRATVRPDHAGEHLHERALAGAVRTEQGVHLPGLDDERGRPQRDDRAVALRNLACGQEAHAWVREGAPGGAPSLFAPEATAPCSR